MIEQVNEIDGEIIHQIQVSPLYLVVGADVLPIVNVVLQEQVVALCRHQIDPVSASDDVKIETVLHSFQFFHHIGIVIGSPDIRRLAAVDPTFFHQLVKYLNRLSFHRITSIRKSDICILTCCVSFVTAKENSLSSFVTVKPDSFLFSSGISLRHQESSNSPIGAMTIS